MDNLLSRLSVTPLGSGRYDNLAQFKVTHDYFTHWTVIILHAGEIRYSIGGGGEHVLRAGELLICPPFHNVDKAATSPVSFSIFSWDGGRTDPGVPLGELVYPVNDRIREDIRLLEALHQSEPFALHLQTDIWFQLCYLYRDPIIPMKAADKPDTFTALLDMIDASLDKKLTLDGLAASAGYSKASLIRYFRENTGLTPMQYVTDRRIAAAKKKLPDTHLTVREIALDVGFPNEFYFSTVFHRQTGMTPSEFRKRNSRLFH